jgi:DNA-binding NarL/FixJ family response regulator
MPVVDRSWGTTEGAVQDGEAVGRTLTPRERQVLEHAALGLSNRQIGDTLEIAEQTVKNHLNSAMRKLSLHDRTHAVVFAIGSGLISLPVPRDVGWADERAPDLLRDASLEPSAD